MELLEEFAAAGGQVIFCGQIPGYLEGVDVYKRQGYVRLQSGIQRKKAAGLMRSSGHRTEAADCYRLAEVLSNIAAQIEEAARFDGGSAEGKTYTLPTAVSYTHLDVYKRQIL